MSRFFILLISLIIFTSCNQCATDVDFIKVDYDNIDEVTFRAILPIDFDKRIENRTIQKTVMVTDKCDIRSIVDELDYIVQQNNTTKNIDARMRFSISGKDTVEYVYLGLNSIMINGKAYWIQESSLINILNRVDKEQLNNILFE